MKSLGQFANVIGVLDGGVVHGITFTCDIAKLETSRRRMACETPVRLPKVHRP